MIALFTDYGMEGPYLGQVAAKLHELAPGVRIVNLMSDAPRQNPKAGAYLLPAFASSFAPDTIFFCVVDPGVGTGVDLPTVVRADNQCFVGPDNGLFDLVIRRSGRYECRRIQWQPDNLSASFHGRDLFAPVCARLALGDQSGLEPASWTDPRRWPDDLWEVVYIDGFGNAMLGVRSHVVDHGSVLTVRDREIERAETFGNVAQGVAFWHANSNGLVEIAVNRGSAAGSLGLNVGDAVRAHR